MIMEAILVLFFFYMEVTFSLSTGGSFFSMPTLYMLLFSITYGTVAYLLTSLIKKPLVNKIIRFALFVLMFLIYIIEFFIYVEFGVFYDLNTSFGGAGDAMGGFQEDIMLLIFCFNGISHILLFSLPAILYAIFGFRFDKARTINWPKKGLFFSMGVLTYVLALFLVYDSEVDANAYDREYNYEAAINNFGLFTADRLDLKHMMKGGTDDFDLSVGSVNLAVATPTPTPAPEASAVVDPSLIDIAAGSEAIVTPEPTPIEYGKNELDIDFEALAEETKSSDLAKLDRYVASLTPSSKNEYTGMFEGFNLIMISAEAFSAEVIDEQRTPTLYRMANKGIQFTDYYQPASAGTTGGEFNNLMGMLPMAGGKSMKNIAKNLNYYTVGYQLNELGYFGKAYHNNDYKYYSRDITHVTLGYSAGYEGKGNGMEVALTKAWPESDLEMMEYTIPQYIDEDKFNIYYMSVSGHSLYDFAHNAMARKHKDIVEDMDGSELVRGYLACQQEFEDSLTYLINALEEKGIADKTVICISADHYPYGLDTDSTGWDMPYLDELYGYEVENYLQRDHNRLIIWSGALEDKDPIVVDTPVFSCDIVPTLFNLFGVEFDSRLLAGRDVFSDAQPLMFNTAYDWKTDLGYYIAKQGTFYPNSDDLEIPDDYVKTMKAIVSNKINYMKNVPALDYYRHVFAN